MQIRLGFWLGWVKNEQVRTVLNHLLMNMKLSVFAVNCLVCLEAPEDLTAVISELQTQLIQSVSHVNPGQKLWHCESNNL